MLRIFPVILAALAVFASGCAFASKDIKLVSVSASQPESDKLEGLDFSIEVTDARNQPGLVGSTGWSFADVRTKDSVADWFRDALESELQTTGGNLVESAKTSVMCSINDLHASLGFLSLINSKLAIGVTIADNGEEEALGEFTMEHSPFVFFDSQGAYEEAISETLKMWMARHAPKIISVLASIKSKPVEPETEPEVTTEPEKPPVGPEKPDRPAGPQPPDLTVSSPTRSVNTETPSLVVSGRAANAAGGILRALVNGAERRSIHLATAHEPFSIPLPLSAGKNEIRLILALSGKRDITRELKATYSPPLLAGRRALLLGVDRFKNLPASPNAENACRNILDTLKPGVEKKSRANYRMLGSGASVRNVLSELKKNLAETGQRESLIICYAGRIIDSGGELAMAVKDSESDNPASTVLFSDIVLAVERHFSGEAVILIAQAPRENEPAESTELSVLESPLSILLYYPSGGGENAVSQCLSGAGDADRDGYVTLAEMKTYLGSKGSATLNGNVDTGFRVSRVSISGN